MSSETILPSSSSTSSRSASTRCLDSDAAESASDSTESASDLTESASDSNSLFEEKTDTECVDNCIDVKINCASNRTEAEMRESSTVYCNPVGQCVWGVLLIIISISGFIFTPLDFMLWEKLHMRPGLPPYEWWVDPPDEVKLRVYVFNVTNHERFMDGLDDKLNVQEIGPIVYLEKLLHSNISFNENGTMSYIAKRYPIFLPNENTIDMNATLIVPNLAVLGMASYLHDASFFLRSGFNILVATHNSELFSKKTIDEYLWDFRDPVLRTSSDLLPGLVPVDNMGMLARIYADFTDEVTVKIGTKWGDENFFQIDMFRGNPQLPGYDPDICPDRLTGSTEGVMYRQRLTKQDILLYWRKTVCKLMPLYFDSEQIVDSVPVYRYNLSENVFDRVQNGTDCYDTLPYNLPAGVSDASKCYFDFPMVASYPHFYTGGLNMNYTVTGLEPDRYKHNSYVIVEPLTGTPFRSVARMQSNLRMYDMSDFSSQYNRLSNLILPLFWAEYNQEGLPPRIRWTIYFIIQVLPPLTMKSQKQDLTIQNVVDKSHCFPEPDTPPLDDTIGSNICHHSQPVPNYLANIPSQRFGEPVFPKYFSTVATPVFWAPIQMFVPPEATKITSSQITQTFEPRCILRHHTDIPLSKRFSKPIFNKEIRFENRFKTNKFCDTSTPNKQPTVDVKFNKSVTNPTESIFKCSNNLPKIPFPRTSFESEINTVPNIFNNVKQNSTLNLSNSLSKPNHSTFTQTPSWPISTLTPNTKVENPAKISSAKNFLSKSDECSNIFDQKSTLKASSKVSDLNSTEEMYNQLDSEDLRFLLCAKRRISVDNGDLTEGKKSKSNVTNVTAKKRVTFDLGDVNYNANEDNESYCNDIMDEVRNPSIEFLRNLAKPSMNKQCWYLVVDTEVLLDEYDFIDKFVKSDEKCKLLIPYVVRRDIETMSKGDCCGRHRIIVARQLCRRLCMPGDHVVLQPDLGDDKRIVTNAILNCCIEIKRIKNRHVVFITNDTVLLNKAKTLNIYGYKLQEIKDGVAPPQKVTFDIKYDRKENLFLQNDLRNVNSEQIFRDLFSNNSKNRPILDDKIINITKPKHVTQPNMDSTMNYEYDTVDSSSEIGRDINKMNIKDTSQVYTKKSLFEDENQSKFINATKSTKLSYIEQDIKRFYVKNKLMEEKIKLRINEWICIFSQIMEDILTDILFKISSRLNKPPPWYLCEAIECIKLMYAKYPTVVTVLNKFSLLLFNCSCKKGKLKSSMNAKDFINILGYGITLLQTMHTVTPSQGLSEAQEKLNSMLRTIEDPSIESDMEFVTPVVRRTEVTKASPTKRYNFQKNREDIIKYLKKHFPQWESYNEESKRHNYNEEHTINQNPKIVRTFGKNLGQLKIDNNKNISMESPTEPLSLAIGRNNKMDGPKVVRTVKDVVINKRQDVETTKYPHNDIKNNDIEIAVPKFKRILKTNEERIEGPKVIRHLEKSYDFLLKNSAIQSMKKDNIKVVFRSDINNCESDLNIPKHGNTFEVRDESKEGPKIIRTFDKVNSFLKSRNLQETDINKRELKHEPKVTVNMKIIDAFEKKLMKNAKEQNFDDLDYEFDDSLSNINSNNISHISIDNYQFDDEEINNAYLPDHDTTRIKTQNHSNNEKNKLDNNIGIQTTNKTNEMSNTTVTSVFFSDPYQRKQNHDTTNIGFASHRDDSTNDSGFENESLQAYSLAKSFLNEVSSSFKMIYQFIDKSINEVRDEELQEDKKKILHYKVNRTHLHIAQVIEKLKCIIERESNDGTTLKSFLIKVGDASGDKRMSRYRQVVTKSLEQAQMLENALKFMLNIIDDDFTGPPSFITDNLCNSLKYYNIFE